MIELKKCPFCGSSAVYVQQETDYYDKTKNYQFCVVCNFNWDGCGASSGYRDTMQEAIEAWNRRSDNG